MNVSKNTIVRVVTDALKNDQDPTEALRDYLAAEELPKVVEDVVREMTSFEEFYGEGVA